MNDRTPRSRTAVFRFWLPLAATWFMMSVEGPFLAAVIARLPEPKVNLASYGVAFAFAMLLESPVILLMSAATALVTDRRAYGTLRDFTFTLNGAVTAAMALCLLPGVFALLFERGVGLPPEVAAQTRDAALLLLPWPAAIGYRRLYQGILIRTGRTRMVAYGTVVRLSGMASAALFASRVMGLPGATTGALGLSAGVVAEAVAARLMARRSLRELAPDGPGRELTFRRVWDFYLPLALTSVLNLGVNPLVTFFLGQSRLALESLAVLPVVNSLVFLFGSGGLAFQETAIALLGPRKEGYPVLRSFAWSLGAAAALALVVTAYTPLLGLWLGGVSGLSPALAAVAVWPVRLLALQPALTVAQCFQRALLVAARTTRVVTAATVVEVGVIVSVLAAGVLWFQWVGAVAAAAALLSGRATSVLFQWGPARRAASS